MKNFFDGLGAGIGVAVGIILVFAFICCCCCCQTDINPDSYNPPFRHTNTYI